MIAAVYCILAPMAIPIGAVPISLMTLIVYVSLYLLGWRMAAISYMVYLFIGLVGLPVFAGYAGGIGKLLGPTGGYLIGVIPMAVIAGLLVDRFSSRIVQFGGLILGTLIMYALGTAWFCIVMDSVFAAALGICVFPFIPGDIIKIIIAVIAGPILKNRLKKEGVYESVS